MPASDTAPDSAGGSTPEPAPALDRIVVLDFGSQYTQLIARRVREQKVYAEIHPCDAPLERIAALSPRGIILSGGPASVYADAGPQLDVRLLELGVPLLGSRRNALEGLKPGLPGGGLELDAHAPGQGQLALGHGGAAGVLGPLGEAAGGLDVVAQLQPPRRQRPQRLDEEVPDVGRHQPSFGRPLAVGAQTSQVHVAGRQAGQRRISQPRTLIVIKSRQHPLTHLLET